MNLRTGLSVGATAAALLLGATACGSAATQHNAAPPSTTTAPATSRPSSPPATTVTPTPRPTVTVTAPPATGPPAAATTPAPANINAGAVVEQYYQDINDQNYAAAWALGGKNIAGTSYSDYVAGFATTASVSLGTTNDFGSDQVSAVLYATQTDGSVKVYQGTYTVVQGVIVAADIKQE
ncbi:hypothetical protein [Phaeacidiphilus oryzae]|uniref:hypothetical protein n=1 Tax=Phaeacidiphilus oryzae TaxID=348818 RepID=UPI00068A6C5C|nr:hypothetical protein [Phaeacidiphilus oryzae]